MTRLKMIIDRREDLTFDQVIDHYDYDADTGEFSRTLEYDGWCNPKKCYKPVRSSNNRGYYWDRLFNKSFLVHRLIILYMTGSHPVGEVDHINGDRMDNRWVNLRDVNAFDNARNQGNRIDNTSGCRGVTYQKTGRGLKRWKARISHMGVRYSLGYFMTKEEAVAARKAAEERYRYHPNHAKRESWRK